MLQTPEAPVRENLPEWNLRKTLTDIWARYHEITRPRLHPRPRREIELRLGDRRLRRIGAKATASMYCSFLLDRRH